MFLKTVKALSERPHGIFLYVGPTGSGKTTTLHAIMQHINTDERKIWTAEDPIEITQEGLQASAGASKIGFTFASCDARIPSGRSGRDHDRRDAMIKKRPILR